MKKVIILLSALILGVATSCDIFPTETLEPGETARRRRRGSRNSQAKGPALDETLESASTKEAIPQGRIFQVRYRGRIFLLLFFVKGEIIWN